MSDSFDIRAIAASLFAHWADEFPFEVPTVYPGTTPDPGLAAEWIDLSLETWSDRRRRSGQVRMVNLAVVAHCFVKPSSDAGRAEELAEGVRETLENRTLPVRDFEESGAPVCGHVKLFEMETRDLSRPDRDAGHHGMRHLVLRVRGIAQEA